jgi:hypothetical protein
MIGGRVAIPADISAMWLPERFFLHIAIDLPTHHQQGTRPSHRRYADHSRKRYVVDEASNASQSGVVDQRTKAEIRGATSEAHPTKAALRTLGYGDLFLLPSEIRAATDISMASSGHQKPHPNSQKTIAHTTATTNNPQSGHPVPPDAFVLSSSPGVSVMALPYRSSKLPRARVQRTDCTPAGY